MAICLRPINITQGNEEILVPCGNCFRCRDRRSNDWIYRLLQEDKRAISSFFVTLTYDNANVPLSQSGLLSLKYDDVTKFFKRLRYYQTQYRKKWYPEIDHDPKIRYYLVGEYGGRTDRPHYHAVVFNVLDAGLFFDAWTAGSVHVGSVSGDSIAYTTKYVMKPQRIPMFQGDDRVREQSRMSKHIGDNYLTEQMKKWHQQDIERVYVQDGQYKKAMPRYYRDKIYTDTEREQQKFIAEDKAEEQFFELSDRLEKTGYRMNIHEYIDHIRKKERRKLYKNRDKL